jgi:hypothetical protein
MASQEETGFHGWVLLISVWNIDSMPKARNLLSERTASPA